MELALLLLVSLVCAIIVFAILDKNANRGVAVIGCLATFVIGLALPFGMIIAIVITLAVFAWGFMKSGDKADSDSNTTV